MGYQQNILFVLHGPLGCNSGYHVQLHGRELQDNGAECVAAIPDHHFTGVESKGDPELKGCLRCVTYSDVIRCHLPALFGNGRGPDIIYAWTPREHVHRFIDKIRWGHKCSLVIHLEDNECYLTEVMAGQPFSQLEKLSITELDALIPHELYHPVRGPQFLRDADGVTLIIDTLSEFNLSNVPSLVIGAPVDKELFYPRPINFDLRHAQGIPDEDCVLAYTGNLHEGNFAEVAELYQAIELLNSQGYPTHLLRTGHGEIPLDARASARDYIHHLGWLSRKAIPDVLAATDILVQPGHSDAFNVQRIPSKLPEFFAMGRPVILPKVNIGLLAQPNLHAIVLDNANASSISEAVMTLRDDSALAQRLARGAVEFHRQALQAKPSRLYNFMEKVARLGGR